MVETDALSVDHRVTEASAETGRIALSEGICERVKVGDILDFRVRKGGNRQFLSQPGKEVLGLLGQVQEGPGHQLAVLLNLLAHALIQVKGDRPV